MKILVVGGTRFFGIPMVNALIRNGHEVTIATRGNAKPVFEGPVEYVVMDRTDASSVKRALDGRHFDFVIDKIAYSSNDVKALLRQCGSFGRHLLVERLDFAPLAPADRDIEISVPVFCDYAEVLCPAHHSGNRGLPIRFEFSITLKAYCKQQVYEFLLRHEKGGGEAMCLRLNELAHCRGRQSLLVNVPMQHKISSGTVNTSSVSPKRSRRICAREPFCRLAEIQA